MWGAGQMMFNKILVIADQGIKSRTTEHWLLMSCVISIRLPIFIFPRDRWMCLDHSCSKLGFGGKMCIDGTAKSEEEISEEYGWTKPEKAWLDSLPQIFSEIHSVNTSLLEMEMPVLIVSAKKERPGHIRELHQQICGKKEAEGIKLILYVEHTVVAGDLPVALWRFCNNLDPKRDQTLVQRPSQQLTGKTFACLGLDGTIKTKELDNFQRDWPNIIVSDAATISSVDEKWGSAGTR
jgi:4-hydroxy-3-polyprenylbenzoate decarboxylase